jgi:hypothetical protein
MNTNISRLLDEMRGIQEQLERSLDSARETFRYMVNDRHRLAYLNIIEKANCGYCGYANGVMAYAREIISRTEQHWCPIRHARQVPDAHKRYPQFFPCGDAVSWREKLQDKRRDLVAEPAAGDQE